MPLCANKGSVASKIHAVAFKLFTSMPRHGGFLLFCQSYSTNEQSVDQDASARSRGKASFQNVIQFCRYKRFSRGTGTGTASTGENTAFRFKHIVGTVDGLAILLVVHTTEDTWRRKNPHHLRKKNESQRAFSLLRLSLKVSGVR